MRGSRNAGDSAVNSSRTSSAENGSTITNPQSESIATSRPHATAPGGPPPAKPDKHGHTPLHHRLRQAEHRVVQREPLPMTPVQAAALLDADAIGKLYINLFPPVQLRSRS
jgi:hypothetical protein